ncbi:unnamed protein product [Acidithrix sp. C25]|nr:unnamed protein product [Acidithrix sp. C25]
MSVRLKEQLLNEIERTRIGTGRLCPHCDEPVAHVDLDN